MPLIDITNPDVIKFLVESYDKTARLRMKWNSLFGENLKQAATLQREEKGYDATDVLKMKMMAGMPTITRDFKSGTPNRKPRAIRDSVHIPAVGDIKKGHSIVDVGLGDPDKDPRLGRPDTDLTIDPVMRPIDPEQKNIIFKGLPYYGRRVYLKNRNKMSPEDKYYFTQSSSWEHGWRLKDSYFSGSAPKHGRVWRLNNDLNGRSGPHPDPPHYRWPEIAGPNKCSL